MKNTPLIFLLSCFLFLFIEGTLAQSMKELIKEKITEDLHHRITYLTHDYTYEYVQSLTDDPSARRSTIVYLHHPGSLRFNDSIKLKYDINGNMSYRENLLYKNGAWEPLGRTSYTYHNDSRPMMWESESFEGDLWEKSLRWVYEYDSERNLISEKYNNYNTETNEWEIWTIYSYEYDENGNQVRYLRQVRYSGDFRDDMEMVSSFDDRNNKIESRKVERNIGERRILFDYDVHDNLIKRESQKWENDTWIPTYRILLEYFNKWTEPSKVLYQTNSDLSGWISDRKYEMEYDDKGRLFNTILSYWKKDDNKFSPSEKFSIYYDEENREVRLAESYYLLYSDEFIEHEHTISRYEFADDGNLEHYVYERSSPHSIYKIKFFYDSDGQITNTLDYESVSLSIFPNPASDYALIEWGEEEFMGIELYDINGRQLMRDYLTQGSKAYNLRLEGYSAGMYTVLLRDKQGNVATERVLITVN